MYIIIVNNIIKLFYFLYQLCFQTRTNFVIIMNLMKKFCYYYEFYEK